jgi:hypothetical protein
MTITGKLIKKMPLKSGISSNGRTWSTGEIILETEGDYPKKAAIEVKEEMYAQLKEGNTYTIHVEVSSREYNEKWYTSVKGWKYENN